MRQYHRRCKGVYLLGSANIASRPITSLPAWSLPVTTSGIHYEYENQLQVATRIHVSGILRLDPNHICTNLTHSLRNPGPNERLKILFTAPRYTVCSTLIYILLTRNSTKEAQSACSFPRTPIEACDRDCSSSWGIWRCHPLANRDWIRITILICRL